MKLTQEAPGAFVVDYDSEEELRAEQESALAAGGLLLQPAAPLPLFSRLQVTIRLSGRGEARVAAVVVALPPGGLALQIEGKPDAVLEALLTAPQEPDEDDDSAPSTLWDRLRAMTPPQRILLAPKADRATRALLLQDTDQQVLFALLKNPRLSVEEVVRAAKSSALSVPAADFILRTNAWSANPDVRIALIRNPKLPVPIALRILPTLPESEVRALARGAATSMPLKQAALKRLHP
jgi:hypothetical protein